MFRCARSLAGLLAAALSLPAAAQDEPSPTYQLKYHFSAGQMLEYAVENASTISVQVGDVADTVEHASESGKVLRVDSVDSDGNALVEARINYVRLTADHQAEHVEWDSRSGEQPPDDFRAVAETIGAPLGTVRVAPNGRVTVVTLRGAAAAGQTETDRQLDLLPVLPEAPVAVGDSWTEEFEVQIMATPTLKKSVSLQRLYTLKSVADGKARIDVRTIVLSPVRDPLEEGQLIQRTPSGAIVLDIAAGKLLSREMRIDKRVVGFQGPQTSLQVTGARNESLVSEEKAAAAEKPEGGLETSARP